MALCIVIQIKLLFWEIRFNGKEISLLMHEPEVETRINQQLSKIKIILNFKSLYFFAYTFFSYLLLKIVLTYIPYNTDVGFLIIKQDEIQIQFYKVAFFIHVYTSMLVIPAGFTQFSTRILRNHKFLHSVMGWIYVVVLVFLSGPAGFIMAIYAEGGLFSQISFGVLAVLWIFYTSFAIIKIKKGDIRKHREYLIRSFALTLSAITLRGWKYLLALLFDIRPNDLYMIVAWLGWVPNILIAEFIIRKISLPKNEIINKLKKIYQ